MTATAPDHSPHAHPHTMPHASAAHGGQGHEGPSATVIAGTVNGSVSLRVTVTGTGERTALANIMRQVEQAQTSRSRTQALGIASAVERDSEHTIAQCIVKSAEEQALRVPKAERFEAIPGHGVTAVVESQQFYISGRKSLA